MDVVQACGRCGRGRGVERAREGRSGVCGGCTEGVHNKGTFINDVIAEGGEGVSQKMTKDDEGEGGVWGVDDVIYEWL